MIIFDTQGINFKVQGYSVTTGIHMYNMKTGPYLFYGLSIQR